MGMIGIYINGKPPMGCVVPIRDDNELDCELEFGAFYISVKYECVLTE